MLRVVLGGGQCARKKVGGLRAWFGVRGRRPVSRFASGFPLRQVNRKSVGSSVSSHGLVGVAPCG